MNPLFNRLLPFEVNFTTLFFVPPITLLVLFGSLDLQKEKIPPGNEHEVQAQSIREELRSEEPSSELRAAMARFLEADPSASFTMLRGHVDAFSAQPKATVPDYAQRVLERRNITFQPYHQPKVETDQSPDNRPKQGRSHVKEVTPIERPFSEDIGFEGEDDEEEMERTDNQQDEDGVPDEPESTTWYVQEGQNIVKDILVSFFRKHNDVFELTPEMLQNGLPNLRPVKYGVGKHFRRAEFTQQLGRMPLLDSKTIVLFDLNWNVIVISRQIVTRDKLDIIQGENIPERRANGIAGNELINRYDKTRERLQISNSRMGIDIVREMIVWHIDIVDTESLEEYTVTIDARTGDVLNVSDNTANYNDAKVKRWAYTGGDMTAAYQVTTSNLYTHDDNTLVHDFFYMMNDDRNDGGTGDCTDTSPTTSSTPDAYTSVINPFYIRPTRRGDRDFSLWRPSASKGSFGEGHVYFWARKYMLWQKQALVDLGVLTLGNFNNYEKVMIIVNACNAKSGSFHNNFTVSTWNNIGEGLPVIILPDRCRSGNSNCSASDYADSKSGNLYTYEDNGGYHFPGVITHELNHFVMQKYFGIDNGRDCDIAKENKYFQEGGLGRTLPQMFWHHYYNVGYLPATTNHLFRSNGTSGKVHDPAVSSSLNHLDDFVCEDGVDDPYGWGGVVVQPFWEIYHGKEINGSTMTGMARPAQDLGMIKSVYYAADLADASTFQDRWEVANRFMEFWDLFSTAKSSTKTDWCATWGHHGLDTFISNSYCN